MMTIFELSSSSQKKWDAYVCGSSDATFMHLAGWQHILKQQYNHKTHFLYAQENDKVVGVLPLIHIKSLLAGHYITSLPGGVSARDEATAYALLKHAQQMTQAQKAQYLIIRDSSHHWQLDGMVSTAEHCTAVLPLATDPDEVWQGIKASKRRQAKRATKLGLHVQEGLPHLNAFYPLYAEAIQKKGTPTAGLPYYQTVAQQFPNNLKIMAIYQGEQIIGGTFMAHFKDTLYYLWPGVPRQFYSLHPYPLLYWEMARYGCLNGLRLLDLGRSQCGSGALKFKLDWGADSQKLYQLYYLNNIDKPPPVGHSMDAQLKYQLFFAVWQRLPWALAEQIGPQLRKQMPFG